MEYRRAGVDIDAANRAVARFRELARATYTPGVLSEIGGFGGLFSLDTAAWREPVLVASADGVGTKLRVACLAGRHRGVGADLVNHCVNDVLVQGAIPLFFMDYFATGRLSPAVATDVVAGVADACRENGCALLGGETAEMPGFYADGDYDIAGFIVGVVERGRLIDGRRVAPGDAIVAVPSTGLHTNGYSLARRILFDVLQLGVDAYVDEIGATVADALLAPHRSYLGVVRPLLGGTPIRAMAHVTGGGIIDNLPRVLPAGTAARIDRDSWSPPPIFQFLQSAGGVPDREMFRTFNMGAGLLLVCDAQVAGGVIEAMARAGEPGAWRIGQVTSGSGVVFDPPLRSG